MSFFDEPKKTVNVAEEKVPHSVADSPGGQQAPSDAPNESREAVTAPGGHPATPPEPASAEQSLHERLAKLQAERDDLFKTLVRRQADFENYRKRVERERREDAERTAARVVSDLLPVLDALERALASLPQDEKGAAAEYRRGFELIRQQLSNVLRDYQVARISAVGRKFDPRVHQAVERVETAEHPEGTVLEELQAGYKMRERVLRPSIVRVAALPPAPPSETEVS